MLVLYTAFKKIPAKPKPKKPQTPYGWDKGKYLNGFNETEIFVFSLKTETWVH